MFTARYGLVPRIEEIIFHPYKVKCRLYITTKRSIQKDMQYENKKTEKKQQQVTTMS